MQRNDKTLSQASVATTAYRSFGMGPSYPLKLCFFVGVFSCRPPCVLSSYSIFILWKIQVINKPHVQNILRLSQAQFSLSGHKHPLNLCSLVRYVTTNQRLDRDVTQPPEPCSQQLKLHCRYKMKHHNLTKTKIQLILVIT